MFVDLLKQAGSFLLQHGDKVISIVTSVASACIGLRAEAKAKASLSGRLLTATESVIKIADKLSPYIKGIAAGTSLLVGLGWNSYLKMRDGSPIAAQEMSNVIRANFGKEDHRAGGKYRSGRRKPLSPEPGQEQEEDLL